MMLEMMLYLIQSEFTVLTPKQVCDLIINAPIKSSALNPILADLFKLSLPTLLPILTSIINLSLQSGIVPTQPKQAQLSPILKTSTLNNTLNTYSLISNLHFIPKFFEHAFSEQLTTYIADNNLYELLPVGMPLPFLK